MESIEDSNCLSMSDSFSLYERYMRSFNVRENFYENNEHSGSFNDRSNRGNIDLSIPAPSEINKHYALLTEESRTQLNENIDKGSDSIKYKYQINFSSTSLDASTGPCHTDKSNEGRLSSDGYKPGIKPVFISSIMENSNNAVDSVPLFRDTKDENVFKLPISELSFNGTIKHVQKLKPIVDPLTAFSIANHALDLNTEKPELKPENENHISKQVLIVDEAKGDLTESSGDSQYQDKVTKEFSGSCDSKWNLEQSSSSLEASFDSGVRSPDMFLDDDLGYDPPPSPFWNFLHDVGLYEKKKIQKIQETLQGVLPPPSVTTLKTDVTQMLKKYYCFLPAFNGEESINIEENSMTPTKKFSFIKIPQIIESIQETTESVYAKSSAVVNPTITKEDGNSSINDKTVELKMCSESEVLETNWPAVAKCRFYDVYYNLTTHSENHEVLIQKLAERFVGAETDTSVSVHSGGMQSPSSACKRKALRLKMAQAKSPGRRLSHLARRRQAFCSAATIGEKLNSSSGKMVLIDKNFFPHRKLINTSERKSPRMRRTPGKKTPTRKTPGKKTPKTQSGGSSKKKAMRRLIMDDNLSRTQPNRETLKRALFMSPENRKNVPTASSNSVPSQTLKSRRALFGSPIREAESKSMDGTRSDHFMKRKRSVFDDEPDTSRCKIAKSLSFGGDNIVSQPISLNRRASEMVSRTSSELNETHKKKLLWAVSEALRLHGWRMSSPGFREKASNLARLTRKLLTLPQHAARLAAPNLSTSDTLFKLAKQYVFNIIQGRSVEECFQDALNKQANENNKLTGYISATAYQELKSRPTLQVKENILIKQEPKSASKNILQDKLVNIDSNSNSNGIFEKVPYKSNSMPSFEEAKMRARRQISFDNVDFPKR